MLIENELKELFIASLKTMGGMGSNRGPRSLSLTLEKEAEYDELVFSDEDYQNTEKNLIDEDPNNYFFSTLGKYIRRWDAAADVKWVDETTAYSNERREKIMSSLKLSENVALSLNDRLPPYPPEGGHPVVIASEHEEWYFQERKDKNNFYWSAYENYLSEQGGWPEDSIIALDQASDMVVKRLSDPCRREIKTTKGLVVGYVQSGKTANFTAVTAKAVDAGYRLIIVIAGTLDILREQTQRRFDKELIGIELIKSERTDHDYLDAPDWNDFISHSDLPSNLGSFNWKRLTGEKEDYKKLHRNLEALEFKSVMLGRRFNDPANLDASPATLLVVKKNPSVLRKLNEDLRDLATHLEEVPVLIIDDESDQASVNTVNPDKKTEKDRTATNEQIIKLVNLLNRAQYIGYTATPFANVFINPKDAEDLFPSDYIVTLPRPKDYMGIYDFFDFNENLEEPDEGSERVKETAHIRDTKNEQKEEDGNLSEAIHAFILAGALKLFRKEKGLPVSDKHHTMLVHRSVKIADHEEDAILVQQLYNAARPGTVNFYENLEKLWKEDFKQVTENLNLYDVNPSNFEELKPFVDGCISLVQKEGKEVRIINGDKKNIDDLPNFDRDRTWSILVGGTKLSRGYTVEGLTVSYYRRKIKTSDTLMQVGRWFGFRKGYKDLVRLYVSRSEPDGRNRTIDLYAAFKSICRDEEMFRKELQIYSEKSDPDERILPVNIPPIVPMSMLPPTAKNKSWHVNVQHMNFATKWKESGHPKSTDEGRRINSKLFRELVDKSETVGRKELSYSVDKNNKLVKESTEYYIWKTSKENLIDFINGYKWNVDGLLVREIDFLKGTGDKDPGVSECIILCPQLKKKGSHTWNGLSVKRRNRIDNKGFNGFSEPRHVKVADAIALQEPLKDSNTNIIELIEKERAVLVIYPTIGNDDIFSDENIKDKDITIGFGLKFPSNKIQTSIVWGHD